MIYIIFDSSYEWDDYMDNGEKIVYCGTNKEEAERIFHKYHDDTPNMSDDKWCYHYTLWEFPDGYNYYTDLNEGPKKLLDVCNFDKDE